MPEKKRLMIVDDEPEFAEIVTEVAEGVGLEAAVVNSGSEFLEAAPGFQPDVVLLDLIMPDMDGIEVMQSMEQRGLSPRVLLTSGYDESYLHSAEMLGAGNGLSIAGSLRKPADIEQIEALLMREIGTQSGIQQ